MKNKEFKKLLINYLFQEDNQEHKIRFSDLLNIPEFVIFLDESKLLKSIIAFRDLEGRDWHPMISLSIPERNADPNVIALFDIEPNLFVQDIYAIYEGYPENEMPQVPALHEINGELWPIDDFYLDAEYVENNEVWVIGLDENNEDGTFDIIDYPSSPCQSNFEPSVAGKIQNMTVKLRKEHFLANRSEVNIVRITTWDAPNFGQSILVDDPEIWNLGKTRKYKEKDYATNTDIYFCIQDSEGDHIRKFSRSEIKNKESKALNFSLIKSWKPISGSPLDIYTYPTCLKANCVIRGNIMYYVIFEFDSWPAPEKSAWVLNPADGQEYMELKYRSWDVSYNENFIRYANFNIPANNTNIRGHSIDQWSIKLNTKME